MVPDRKIVSLVTDRGSGIEAGSGNSRKNREPKQRTQASRVVARHDQELHILEQKVPEGERRRKRSVWGGWMGTRSQSQFPCLGVGL